MSEKKYRRVYYVVFEKNTHPRWWKIFLNKEVNHCYLITPVTDCTCVLMNPTEGGVAVYTYSKSAFQMLEKLTNICSIVKRYEVHDEDIKKIRLRLFRNCVGFCKDLLGIHQFFIFTPKQLLEYVSKEEEV